MKKFIIFFGIIISLMFPAKIQAHYKLGAHNIKHAINLYWCGHSNKNCRYGAQALRIAWCESRYNINAINGQYRGLFQMGDYERRLFGHGNNPWAQAKAAHKYFIASRKDWSPWSCRWAAY